MKMVPLTIMIIDWFKILHMYDSELWLSFDDGSVEAMNVFYTAWNVHVSPVCMPYFHILAIRLLRVCWEQWPQTAGVREGQWHHFLHHKSQNSIFSFLCICSVGNLSKRVLWKPQVQQKSFKSATSLSHVCLTPQPSKMWVCPPYLRIIPSESRPLLISAFILFVACIWQLRRASRDLAWEGLCRHVHSGCGHHHRCARGE